MVPYYIALLLYTAKTAARSLRGSGSHPLTFKGKGAYSDH